MPNGPSSARSSTPSRPAPPLSAIGARIPPPVVAAPGAPTRGALWRAVEEIKEGDPFAPVTVAVPSPYAGLSLRHALAARAGLVNVRFMSLHRIAELVGAAFLPEGRRPRTSSHRIEATRLAVEQDPLLDPSPRTIHAVSASLDAASRHGLTPTGTLGRIAAFRDVLLADSYDDETVLASAADALDSAGATLGDLGTVIWYLPADPSPGAQSFTRALADTGSLVIVTTTIDDAIDHGIEHVVDDMFVDGAPEVTAHTDDEPGTPTAPFASGAVRTETIEVPTATELVVAPDRDTEVRAVAAKILSSARAGTPFHRIAVTFTQTDPYLALAHERFTAADIPIAGPSSRTLAETPAGRILRMHQRAIDADYARDAVMDLLGSTRIRPGLADERDVARWDRIASAAGIVAGAETWRTHLAHFANEVGPNDAASARAATELANTVSHLLPPHDLSPRDLSAREVVDGQPIRPTWEAAAASARSILQHLLGDGSHLDEAEQTGFAAVVEILDTLASLDDLGGDAGGFPMALEHALSAPDGRAGVVGTGVLVVPMSSLVGTDFDVVHVLGLDEGATGASATDDPLLAGHGLGARELERRRHAFLGALACAPRRVMSLARADLRSARALAPSSWILESAAALNDRYVSASELLQPETAAEPLHGVEEVGSLVGLVCSDPPSPLEARLATLLSAPADAHAAGDDSVLARGFDAVRARSRDRAGRWDGVTGPLDGLTPSDDRPFSATSLEHWATCPFRYFLRSVLGLRPVEHPEELDRMEPRVRGTLIHDALAEFVGGHLGKTPDERWSPDDRAELVGIVDRLVARAEAEGLTGHPALWALDRRDVDAQIAGFLQADDTYRAVEGVSPKHVEVGFGTAQRDPEGRAVEGVSPKHVEVGFGTAQPGPEGAAAVDATDDFDALELEIGAHRLRVRGRIDRVDMTPDGTRVEVIDYKTGRPYDNDFAADPVAGGTLLQPVLYAMVMRREHPDASVGFRYWYTRDPDDPFDGIDEVDDDAVDRLTDVLATTTDAIAEGTFPRDPGADGYWGPEHCRYCDFVRVCPTDRARVAQSRAEDPAFVALDAIRTPPDEKSPRRG